LPNSAAGPVKGAITPTLKSPLWVGTDPVELVPQAASNAAALRASSDTGRVLSVPIETLL
jgi:hypothetical protein